jgi:hypothetical protein
MQRDLDALGAVIEAAIRDAKRDGITEQSWPIGWELREQLWQLMQAGLE